MELKQWLQKIMAKCKKCRQNSNQRSSETLINHSLVETLGWSDKDRLYMWIRTPSAFYKCTVSLSLDLELAKLRQWWTNRTMHATRTWCGKQRRTVEDQLYLSLAWTQLRHWCVHAAWLPRHRCHGETYTHNQQSSFAQYSRYHCHMLGCLVKIY